MSSDESESYVSISCLIVAITKAAVLVALDDDLEAEHWVPRSTIHGVDDGKLAAMKGKKMELRMFEWKARQIGAV